MSTPTQKRNLRKAMASYGFALIANEPNVHYTQARPFPFYDDPKAKRIELDCSATVCNVFWHAMHTYGLYIHDPLNERYTGYGNTTTEEAWLRAHGKAIPKTATFFVGDIARVGVGGMAHTVVCIKNGTWKTAVWLSHGWEGGPSAVNLYNYRVDEFVGVWRHPALL